MASRISWPGRPAAARSEKSMDNAVRTRQRVLALFLPVAAVLYIGGEALSPRGTDQVVTTTAVAFKVLPIAAQHPGQLYLASSLVLLGGLGAFCGVIINVSSYPVLAAAATAHVSRGAAATLLVGVFNSEFGHV